MTAALASRVRQRVLDRPDSPAFLVEHHIIEHAADRQLGVLFNRIVLQVFVPPVAVDDIFPVGIKSADTTAQRQAHHRRLHVERFVVFDHPNGIADVERLAGRLDRFEEQTQIERGQKLLGLNYVGTFSVDGQSKRLESRRRFAPFQK